MVDIKGYFIFTRRGLACLFASLCLLVLIACDFYSVNSGAACVKTNAQRVQFINSLNLVADDQCIADKQITIPDTFSDVYQNYNDLQKSAGYDLSAYKGAEVRMYTYALDQYNPFSTDTVVNLLVYKGRVIGGDISSAALDGFMLPLKRKENWNR